MDSFPIDQIILIVFVVFTGLQLIYYWLVFSRFSFYKQKNEQEFTGGISVVIAAKNEYQNLKKNLPPILNQNYPEFEVVVVNDASDDETIFLLEDLDNEYENLKIVTIQQNLNFFRGKKFALSLGIKSAKFEHLLLTDADCLPAGENWIQTMANGFANNQEVVLGYGKLSETKGFLNQIIRYETVFTALQYFSFARMGYPYMGVGRNLAYKKKLFIENKGFISHYKVSSGDDDLFINQVAIKGNTAIVADPAAFTSSPSKKRWSEWWQQKRRHLSTGKHYKLKHKILLGGYSFSWWLMFLTAVVLLILSIQPELVIGLLAIRLISQLIIFKMTCDRLEEKKLLVISPVIELIVMLIYPVIFSINLVFKESKWK